LRARRGGEPEQPDVTSSNWSRPEDGRTNQKSSRQAAFSSMSQPVITSVIVLR